MSLRPAHTHRAVHEDGDSEMIEEQLRVWQLFNSQESRAQRTGSVHHAHLAAQRTHAQPAAVHGSGDGAPHAHGQTPQPHWLQHRHAEASAGGVAERGGDERRAPDAGGPRDDAGTGAPVQMMHGGGDHIVPNIEGAEARRALVANHVVAPPRSAEALQTTTEQFVVVDSRDRNYNDAPEPNQYTISLGQEYRDVTELALISSCVPSPQHPVRDSNRTLHFNTKDPIVTPASGAATELPTVTVEVDDAGTRQTFTIDYSASTRQAVSVPRGYYEEAAFDHATEAPLQQDALAQKIEALLADKSVTCVTTFDPQSLLYTLDTTFATPFAGDPYTSPLFLNLLFRGDDSFYGETSTMRVNVSGDPAAPVYQTERVGKKQRNYLEGSIGGILGYPPADVRRLLTGAVFSKVSPASDPLTLQGRGTRFTQELEAGVWIYVMDVADPARKFRLRIAEVTSDTECVLEEVGGVTPPVVTASLAWSGRFAAPWVRNLTPDKYIVLHIEQCEALESANNTINRAFVILPTRPNEFEDTDPIIPVKKFNPTQGRLEQLKLSFHNPDGSLYDFLGQNHLLVFRLLRYKQNVNYSHF